MAHRNKKQEMTEETAEVPDNEVETKEEVSRRKKKEKREKKDKKKDKKKKEKKEKKTKRKKSDEADEAEEETNEANEEVSGTSGTSETSESAGVEEKKGKKSKNKKKAESSSEEKTESNEENSNDSNDSSTPENKLSELQEETNSLFKQVLESVNEYSTAFKNIHNFVRNLQRQMIKERKETAKIVKKLAKGQRKKRRGGNKAPGGFTKPTRISDPMCAFLGVENGTELPRTEVTRRVNDYVKDHNLQNQQNRKVILPDAKLKSLLYLGDDDELTYFNLQKYMKSHFLKRDPKTGEYAPFQPPQVSA